MNSICGTNLAHVRHATFRGADLAGATGPLAMNANFESAKNVPPELCYTGAWGCKYAKCPNGPCLPTLISVNGVKVKP